MHDRVDEQAVLVDQSRGDQSVAEVMLPVTTMSWPGCSFNAATCPIESPPRTVEFCDFGSVMVEETTYFWTRLR